MEREELKTLLHFADINGLMSQPFVDVLDEYLMTKETAESYKTLGE